MEVSVSISVSGTNVPENYESAAIRHFEDANALRASGRPDNAGHLIGFAAECAIKFRIAAMRSATHSPHGHFPDILIAARKQLGQRSNYSEPMYNLLKGEFFGGWHVNRRYNETGSTAEAELIAWFSKTKQLFVAAGIKVKK